uniref:Cyclopropane-fatty-acyl-phospholipid synthase n=1 Tax=Heterorhabditis bacteriophora TaxID=37862 RepID=A0A1I7XQE7_HETBA
MSGDCGKHKNIIYEFIVIQIFLPFIERSNTPVTLYIDNPIHFCWLMILDRKIGLGEAYMVGDWRAEPTPTEFLKLLIRAKSWLTLFYSFLNYICVKVCFPEANCSKNKVQKLDADKMIGSTLNLLLRSLRWITAVVAYIQHRFRDNTISQSVKNIQEHYDLGNDMFTMFLDKTMTYSCALFKGEYLNTSGQVVRISKIIIVLQRSGCSWTGLTISHEQLEFGKKRVKAAGLQNKIDLRYQDYRYESLTKQNTSFNRMAEETYTRVISVEMIEAVGHDFLPEYFRVISDRLKPGGKAVIQVSSKVKKVFKRYICSLNINNFRQVQHKENRMDVTRKGYSLPWLLSQLSPSLAILFLSVFCTFCKRSY